VSAPSVFAVIAGGKDPSACCNMGGERCEGGGLTTTCPAGGCCINIDVLEEIAMGVDD